jgi:hypothetical protein
MTTKEGGKLSEIEELDKLNKLFAKRYTDEDEEYKQTAKPRSQTPPIVDDWGQNNNNYRNQRRYYQNQQYRNYSYDNRYDRNRSPTNYHDKRR